MRIASKLGNAIPIMPALMAIILIGCDDSAVVDRGPVAVGEAGSARPVSIADVVAEIDKQTDVDDQGQNSEDHDAGASIDTPAETRTVHGIVFAGELEPFQDGIATFIMSELPDPGHGDGGVEHLSECAFCRRRASTQTKAVVELRGTNGKLIKTAASELLGIAKGDEVVVTGQCDYDDVADMLTIKVVHRDSR